MRSEYKKAGITLAFLYFIYLVSANQKNWISHVGNIRHQLVRWFRPSGFYPNIDFIKFNNILYCRRKCHSGITYLSLLTLKSNPMILFGSYSFDINSYTAEQLGMASEETQGMRFVIRQQVAHIFFVPIFPTKKVYTIRKGGKLYPMSNKFIEAVNRMGPHKTPLIALVIPAIVAGIALLIFGGIAWGIAVASKQLKQEYASNIVHMDKEIANLTTHDYIEVLPAWNHYNGKGFFLKVIALKDSDIVCQKIGNDLYDDYDWPYQVQNYRPDEDDKMDTVTVSRSDVRAAICRDYSKRNSAFGTHLLKDTGLYCVTKIEYVDGPYITSKKCRVDSSGLTVTMRNIGTPARLVAIKNLGEPLTWDTELPMYLETDRTSESDFTLHTHGSKKEGNYKVQLELTDSTGRKSSFIVASEYSSYSPATVERVR